MAISRRAFSLGMTGLLTALSAAKGGSAAEAPPVQLAGQSRPAHDMSSLPAHWHGKEQIAFFIYPDFTALDMVGPHYMFTNLMGATTHLVARTREPVKSDTGLVFVPSATIDECPLDLDIICVPGGTSGTLAAMQDNSVLRFLKDRGQRATYVTSVCTGSLLLGAAGLLDGYKATSHWVTRGLLPIFGATPTRGRIVIDRNRITGGGVTAGIDFGLALVGTLRDAEYAQAVQLLSEYAPEPPYDAGTPERAPAMVRTMMEGMFADFVKQADAVGRAAFANSRQL